MYIDKKHIKHQYIVVFDVVDSKKKFYYLQASIIKNFVKSVKELLEESGAMDNSFLPPVDSGKKLGFVHVISQGRMHGKINLSMPPSICVLYTDRLNSEEHGSDDKNFFREGYNRVVRGKRLFC